MKSCTIDSWCNWRYSMKKKNILFVIKTNYWILKNPKINDKWWNVYIGTDTIICYVSIHHLYFYILFTRIFEKNNFIINFIILLILCIVFCPCKNLSNTI